MNKQTNTTLFDIHGILNKITISENHHVAELGCGNFGYFVFPTAKLIGAGGRLYAVDILKTTLEEIRKRALLENLQQIETVWSNLEIFKGTKIESSSLDRVLLINVIHQSSKRVEILREAVRMLKSGGKMLIVEWKASDNPFGPSGDKRVSKDALKQAAPKLGLVLETEFEAGTYHYGLIFHKS
ncbi:MAG: class I SAM-dependent methyltransferase [bacterium]|nr:class I SAM-dependent methyltransferase [bacterium]